MRDDEHEKMGVFHKHVTPEQLAKRNIAALNELLRIGVRVPASIAPSSSDKFCKSGLKMT